MKKYFNLNFMTIMGIILAVCVAGYTFLVKNIVPKYVEKMLPVAEEMSKDYVNGSVKIGALTWNGGLTVELDDIIVKDLQDKKVAVLPKTIISLRPWLALQKAERAVSKVELHSPEVYLRLQEDEKWNLTSLMKPSKSEETPFYGLADVKDGKLYVETSSGKWNFGVNGTVDGGANPNFALATNLNVQEEVIKISGLMTTKGVGNLQVNTDKFSFNNYAELVKHYTKINAFAGELLNTHVIWKNNGEKTAVSGELEFANLGGKINFEKETHSFVLAGKVKARDSILDLQKVDALIDQKQELHLIGKADIHDIDNIGGQGLLSSPKLSYKNYTVENLRVPFTLSKKLMQIDKASVAYGGGIIGASATADLRENSLTADILLDKVCHSLSEKPNDLLRANGALALLGRLEEKDNKKTFQVHAAADTVELQWQDLLVNKLVLDGDYDGKMLTLDHFSAWTGDGVFAIKGKTVVGSDGPLALEGRVADFGIGPALYHFANINGVGKLSMNFNITGTTNSPKFDTLVQLRDVDVLEHKLKEMHGRISMADKVLTFTRVGATQTQGRHSLNGFIDLKQEDPILNLDVKSRNVRVEPLVALATKDFALTGNVDNEMHISGTINHPRVEGEVDLTDGSVQTYLFKGVKGKYLYDDGFVGLKDFVVRLFIADVNFSGTMNKNKALNFDIAAHNVNVAKSPYMDPNFTVEGLLDLQGHVTGYLNKPYFEGSVASNLLKLNGESYTSISGLVSSNMETKNEFDISFEQPHQNAKGEALGGVGRYEAKGNLDLEQKVLTGKVLISEGDLAGLLRTNKMEYAIDGYVDGVVDICPNGKGSGINYTLDSQNIRTHNLKYDKMHIAGNFKDYVLDITEMLLQEKATITDKGFLQAYGKIDLINKKLDLKAKAVETNPGIVNIAMKDPLDIKGKMNLDAFVNGSFAMPKAEAKLELLNGALVGAKFDKAEANVSLSEDNIYIKELAAHKDVYGISGKGLIPMDALRAKADRKNANAEMEISLDLEKTELGILTVSSYVDWGTGDIKGNVDIKGTLENPLVYGNVRVEDGTVKLHNVNPVFEHINLEAEFKGDKAELNNLELQLDKKGSIAMKGYYYLRAPSEGTYKFNIVAKDAGLSYASMFKGKLNGDFEITPQAFRDYWHRNTSAQPQYAINKAVGVGRSIKKVKTPINLGPRIAGQGYRPLIKGYMRLDDVVANIISLGDSEIGSEINLGLDLKVELGPKIHMLNAMFYDIWLSGGLDIKGGYYSQTTKDEEQDEKIIKLHNMGPDRLNIEGKIKADKGNITYLRTPFKISDAELQWTEPGEIMPFVKLDSWTRFGKYRIFLNIDGPLSDVKKDDILKLTSTPPLEKNTLVRMLTLQRESADGGNDVTNDDLNNVMTAGLQMALLGNVELWVKQTLGLDQFRVYTGKVNAGIAFDESNDKKQLTTDEKNRYNILISKYMTDRFMVGYTSDFNANEKVIFGQYDIGKNFNLTYSEKQKLDGSRRHWGGVEYRINFN